MTAEPRGDDEPQPGGAGLRAQWGRVLFFVTLAAVLLFFWWLLIRSGGVVGTHG